MADVFDELFDDELNPDMAVEGSVEEQKVEIITPKTATEAKAPVVAKTTTVAKQAPINLAAIFDDVDDLAGIPGVVTGNVGLEVSRFPIERIKFTKSKKDRIAIISSKVIAVKTHYIEGIGSFLCFDGICCTLADTPRVKYLFPVIQYETDTKGRPISKVVTLKVLAVGPEQYEQLVTIQQVSDDITSQDIIVTCTDDNYQKCTFTAAGPANWKKLPDIVQQVAEDWKKVRKYVTMPIAKTLTEKQLIERLNEKDNTKDSGAQAGNDISFDDVFNS